MAENRFLIRPILASKTTILRLKTPIFGMFINKYQDDILAPIAKHYEIQEFTNIYSYDSPWQTNLTYKWNYGITFGLAGCAKFMDGDQLAILFIGLLFLIAGVGLLFVSVDERAEERDKKRGWIAPDLPRTHLFSPYFFVQVRWYRWSTAGLLLILAAMFLAHGFGLLDRFL